MEATVSAMAGFAKRSMREYELGRVKADYFADLILVHSAPLDDITVLQDHGKLDHG